MRDSNERLEAMHARASELRREKRRRQTAVLSAVSVALCLVLSVAAALSMPYLSEKAVPEATAGLSASIFVSNGAVGYIVIAIVAFFAGVAATVFCIRLRRWRDLGEKDRDDD